MNTQHYVAGFDASGRRLVTILCEYDPADSSNESLLQADKEKAAKLASDATVIELIDQATFKQYMDNCVRDMETGKPIPYVAPEPTAAEKKAAAIAAIKAKYQTQIDSMVEARVKAAMLGADTSKIDAQYKSVLTAMSTEIKNA